MSFPDDGSYFTFRLDPVASLQDIEDDVVAKAAREMSPMIYVGCSVEGIGAPQAPPAYEVAYIDLVQQGLPTDSPEEFLESRMCVPIRPNTQHPDGRRPVHCCHPLPWDGCYHVASHRTRVRIRTEMRPVNPPHSLSPSECLALKAMLDDDEQRRTRLRECAAKGLAPPPGAISQSVLYAIQAADEELSDLPYWQLRAAEQAERLARPPEEKLKRLELDENWDADSDYSGASDHSGGAAMTDSKANAQHDAAKDTAAAVDDVANVENVILAALDHRADLLDVSPVIVPLSYDLSSLKAPPSPTGFMEELDAINRIRSEYEERLRQLKDEVRRRDDEYVAGIEARRTAKNPEEPQITSSPSTQSKWPFALNIVPFTNKLKARLVSLRRKSASPASSSSSKVKPRKLRLVMLSNAWKRCLS